MGVEIPLVGGEYDQAPGITQSTVNYDVERFEANGRAKFKLKRRNGLTSFVTGLNGKARGAKRMNGIPYVVQGTGFYSFDSAGNPTLLGTVEGTGRVSMANSSRYMVVVNGTKGYYYDEVSGTFDEITDVDFLPSDVVRFLDGYFIFNETGTTNYFVSAFNDPTSIDALEIQSKGGDPDELVTIEEVQGDIVLLGRSHSYFHRNTGNLDFPFENIEGAEMERGCIAKHSVATIDNSAIFLGDDRIVYWVDGYNPVRVSNHAVEDFLDGLGEEIEEAYAFAYTRAGHYFYVLTAAGETWVYDRTTSLLIGQAIWTKRESAGGPWWGATYVEAYGKHFVGDLLTGTVWQLDRNGFRDGTQPIRRVRRIPPVWNQDRYATISKLQLICKVGHGTYTDPVEVDMRSSYDGGLTWTDPKTRSLGELGKYTTRVIWRRLGQFRERVFEFVTTSDAEVELYTLYAELERG